jgi:hypothetical protein
MSNRNHPIRQVLDASAANHPPTAAELDAISKRAGNYPGLTLRRQVEDASKKVVKVRQGGENGRARRMAREYAAEIIGRVGELEPEERDDDDAGPRKLAARVYGDDPEGPRGLAARIERY